MQRIKRRGDAHAGAANSSLSANLPPMQPTPVPPKHVFKRLAVIQSTLLGLIIGLSCLVLIGLVLIYFHGGFAPRPSSDAVAPGQPEGNVESQPPAIPGITVLPTFSARNNSTTMPSQTGSAAGAQSGKGVHVQMGARGDMIRWRFKVEDEDDNILKLITGSDGVAYIISQSEKLGAGGQRLDAVSASGKIIGTCTEKHFSYSVFGAGAGGVLYRQENITQQVQVPCLGLSAYSLKGHRLWQTQLPHSCSSEVAVGGDGTVYAIGLTSPNMREAHAQSCLCALSTSGKIKWTVEREDYLSWPLPLADGGVLVWNRPRYDRWDSMQYSYDVKSHPELARLSVKLLCLDRDGKLRWSYDVGHIDEGNATVAAGKVCAQAIDAGGTSGHEVVVLSLSSGRELARYPSGPLSAPPLMLPDGAVLFQNQAHVLVKLSPKMKVLWTKALHNPLRHPPLMDREGAIYYSEYGSLVCLEKDGSERFSIPVAGHEPMWGPDGLIYIQGSREVQAFKPE